MSVADWLQRSLGSRSGRDGGLDGSGAVGLRSSSNASSVWKATDNVGRLLEELCRPGVLERRKDGERHLLQYIDAVRACPLVRVCVRAEDGGLAHVPGWGARASFS